VLFDHFATKFREEYKIDVPSNPRASLQLRLGYKKDVKGVIKRDEFEEPRREGFLEKLDHLTMKLKR
jgi:heat shock protein 4